MDMNRAIEILGINHTREGDIGPMVRALGMLPELNTPEENEWREAGQFVLKRWRSYQDECSKRRDFKFSR